MLLKNYFVDFTPLVNKIEFLNDSVTFKKENMIIDIGSYVFYTNKTIIKARYNFVFMKKEDGLKIISHFSDLK